MTKLKSKNKKPTITPTETHPKTPKKIKKQKKQKPNKPLSPNPKKPDPETLQTLLEPYTKPQLITFLIDSALKTPSVYSKILEKAETDVSHRKIFVHGLSWDTTRQTLVSVFEKYGDIEECSLIIDKNTGKAKGFGFVVFKSRDGAKKALEMGKMRVDDRIVSCHLACVGNVGGLEGFSGRKIYVSNVGKDVDSGKLREFFERFGEIEAGPLGFDAGTGKCRGYALFVYKNLDGVKRVLEEPNKVFEGVVLNCRMADSGKGGKSVSSITTVMQPLSNVVGQNLQPLSNVVGQNVQPLPNVVGQNAGLLGQNSGLNTMLVPQMGYNSIYGGGFFANFGGSLLGPPLMGQSLVGVNQFGQMGYGSVMMGQGLGNLGMSQSVLGPYSGSSYAPVFPGLLNANPATNLG